jgi:hypothetical protein
MLWKSLITALPLVAGGLIYAAFRVEHLLMFQWFTAIGLGGSVLNLREFVGAYRHRLPDALVFCVPNGMWLLSYCLALSLLWRDRPRSKAMAWIIALYALATSSEFLQFAGILPGTFDWGDIAAYSGGALLGCLPLILRRSSHA